MQGILLSAGGSQGIVLGDDGVRYAFTPLGWRDASVQPAVGMRVDFEVRGQHAVGVYPISDPLPPAPPPSAPTPPATQPAAQAPSPVATSSPDVLPTPVAPGMRPAQQPGVSVPTIATTPVQMPPGPMTAEPSAPVVAQTGFLSDRRRLVFAGIGAAAIIGIAIGAFVLALNVFTSGDGDVRQSTGSSERAAADVARISATEAPGGPVSSAPDTGAVPFNLKWVVSDGIVNRGESFTLSVRMHGLRHGGGRGGISVSFPSLTVVGASGDGYSSSIADVTVAGYSTGLGNVAFHQPGAQIWDSNDDKISVRYLLVESDDPRWTRSDDRTLLLRITPRRAGDFPIQIRGWLCDDEYANCLRNPTDDGAIDQQDYLNKLAKIQVAETLLPDLGTSANDDRIASTSELAGDSEISVPTPDSDIRSGDRYDPDAEYSVTFRTNKGDIEADLYNDIAGVYVENFFNLAESGFYTNSPWHRVIEGFVIQGGTNADGKQVDELDDVFHPDMKHDSAGILSMANAGINTNTSQFFITHDATPHLDPYVDGKLKPCEVRGTSCHAVFGKVTSGMDVVLSIKQGDLIESVEIRTW